MTWFPKQSVNEVDQRESVPASVIQTASPQRYPLFRHTAIRRHAQIHVTLSDQFSEGLLHLPTVGIL